jgi:hypothetical protein
MIRNSVDASSSLNAKESGMPELSWRRFQAATHRVIIATLLIVVGLMGIASKSSAAATLVPTAADDEYSVTHDQTLNVAAPGVLANDVLPPGWEISVISGPSSGVLTLGADGSVQYAPFAGFVGDDSFVYQMSLIPPALTEVLNASIAQVEPAGAVPQATVTIHVTNTEPVPVDDNYTTPQDTKLVVPEPGVLANDFDAEGDSFFMTGIVDDVDHGTICGGSGTEGSIHYCPDPGFVGVDFFTYTIDDGLPLQDQAVGSGGVTTQGEVNIATVTITVTGVDTPTPEPTAEPTEPGATPIPTEPTPTATTAPTGGVTDLPDTGASPTKGNGSLLGAVIVAMVLAGIGLAFRKTRRRVA